MVGVEFGLSGLEVEVFPGLKQSFFNKFFVKHFQLMVSVHDFKEESDNCPTYLNSYSFLFQLIRLLNQYKRTKLAVVV